MKLLSEHEDVLAEFNSGQVAVPQTDDNGGWIEVSSEAGGVMAGPGCSGRGLWKPRPMGGAGLGGRTSLGERPGAERSSGARGESVDRVGWPGKASEP